MVAALPFVLVGAGTTASLIGMAQGYEASKMQAKQAELASRQEELRGRQSALAVKSNLEKTLASQNAIFAARGISLSSGTPTTLSQQSIKQASYDIDAARFGAGQASDALKAQARQYKLEGKAKIASGVAQMASSGYSLVK